MAGSTQDPFTSFRMGDQLAALKIKKLELEQQIVDAKIKELERLQSRIPAKHNDNATATVTATKAGPPLIDLTFASPQYKRESIDFPATPTRASGKGKRRTGNEKDEDHAQAPNKRVRVSTS